MSNVETGRLRAKKRPAHPASGLRRFIGAMGERRRESPPNSRCLGGQKIRRSTIESWQCSVFELLNARAKSFFRKLLNCDQAGAEAEDDIEFPPLPGVHT